MNKNLKIQTLCKAILQEANDKGYADFKDTSYNKGYMINIGLTIEEIRMAADLIKDDNKDKTKRPPKTDIEQYAWNMQAREKSF